MHTNCITYALQKYFINLRKLRERSKSLSQLLAVMVNESKKQLPKFYAAGENEINLHI